tara:strand:+ start:59676 stop:60068 length:393 start_codon:yes stop_codon:yes gene_type:complete
MIVSSFFANAQDTAEISYTHVGNRSFYACSYAEKRMENYLQAMGAEIVNLRCTGGLPDFNTLRVSAEIVVPGQGESVEWVPVEFIGNEACEFNNGMIKKVMEPFQVRNVESRENCWFSEGRYMYRFEVAN